MMTLRAKALGMNPSTFTNASGLPDPNEWTTARDLAILARHILTDFPGDYPLLQHPELPVPPSWSSTTTTGCCGPIPALTG